MKKYLTLFIEEEIGKSELDLTNIAERLMQISKVENKSIYKSISECTFVKNEDSREYINILKRIYSETNEEKKILERTIEAFLRIQEKNLTAIFVPF